MMKRKILFSGIAAGAALFLSACSTTFAPAELNESDSGRTLTLKVGERFTISLPSNPTTGYAWSFDAPYDEKVLILSSDTFANPEAEGVTGAPGRRILTFSVVGPGRSGIRLGYKRPWERNTRPSRVFQLLVFATGEPPAPLWEEEKTSTPRIGSKGQVVPERKGVFY